jgi:hypothetical protein
MTRTRLQARKTQAQATGRLPRESTGADEALYDNGKTSSAQS